jgi:hypothetical protein
MPRPCQSDWRRLRVDGFLRRRPLVRGHKVAPKVTDLRGPVAPSRNGACRLPQAASTVIGSVRFAAALCEFSGSILIFPSARPASGIAIAKDGLNRVPLLELPPPPARGRTRTLRGIT